MKNLQELAKRFEEQKIQYAYGNFQEEVNPPHAVALETETTNFFAENKVYHRLLDITMNYIDLNLINTIENKILYDVCWNKSETTYLSDEKIWQISYFFEI